MNKIYERTTEAERECLKNTVQEWIEVRQKRMEKDIQVIKNEYKNIRHVKKLNYNPRNLFIELDILDLYEFYYNVISDREGYHMKNKNYYRLLKAFGL